MVGSSPHRPSDDLCVSSAYSRSATPSLVIGTSSTTHPSNGRPTEPNLVVSATTSSVSHDSRSFKPLFEEFCERCWVSHSDRNSRPNDSSTGARESRRYIPMPRAALDAPIAYPVAMAASRFRAARKHLCIGRAHGILHRRLRCAALDRLGEALEGGGLSARHDERDVVHPPAGEANIEPCGIRIRPDHRRVGGLALHAVHGHCDGSERRRRRGRAAAPFQTRRRGRRARPDRLVAAGWRC